MTAQVEVTPVPDLGTSRFETVDGARPEPAAKAAFDRAAAAVLLLAFALPMIVVALAVRLSSPGPVIFRQTRVGRLGREFTLYKFRSMVDDADERLDELRAHDEGAGPLFKMTDDPRVTRVGRVLRVTSLDELPQLWNVLRGDMSLVGPRPALPREVAGYSERERLRLQVKPGVTGLWQVSGRSTLDWETSIGLDLRYVREHSLRGDLVILLRTVGAVLRREGAL